MLKFFLTTYAMIFLLFLSYALSARPEAVVPIVGFFALIYPTFLLCCTVLLLLLRSLPLRSLGQRPVKLSIFSLRK